LFLVCSIRRRFLSQRVYNDDDDGDDNDGDDDGDDDDDDNRDREKPKLILLCFSPSPLPAAFVLLVVDTIITCARRTTNTPESWATWRSHADEDEL
jgi:hypothetical protein